MTEIDLSRNEMPYPPPKRVIEAAEKAAAKLNRYADPQDMDRLKELLADYSKVEKERIILGPGSDLLLRELIQTFSKERKVITVNPSFFPTIQAAKKFGKKMVRIQLTPPDFEINYNLLTEEQDKPLLIVIDNPNNPTGKILLKENTVKKITQHEDSLLIVDEAYFEFSGISFADMVSENPKISITRSLDKAYSLAGARIGYLIAGDYFLNELPDFYTFPSRLGLSAALEAMKTPNYAKENVKKVIKERGRLKEELKKTDLEIYPSDTNFLLARREKTNYAEKLREKGVSVLDLSKQWLPGFLRISIGTKKENDRLITEIKKI